MLVHDYLERSAARAPEATAVIDLHRSITYGALDRDANRFANTFIAKGVRRGDRVIIALDNSVDFVAAHFGVLKCGAVSVPLPGGARNDRLAKAAADCSPAVCLVDADGARELGEVSASCQVVVMPAPGTDTSVPDASVSDAPCGIRLIDRDLAAIIYTSGSTGEPRGVMLTHRNIVANTESILGYLKLTAEDRVMCVLPFHYVYGLSLLHTHVAAGGSLVIDNRFTFPNVVLKAMETHEVTGFAGVPSTFSLLLHRSGIESARLPKLRYVTQAGGGMSPERIIEWRTRGPKVPFFVMYGATEASARLAYLDPNHLDAKLGSIGRAIPNVELRILREDGTLAPPGETGELVARGSNIAPGYWNNDTESRARFSPMGYHTGDLGFADEDGFIFLAGRRHDMIKVGAHRVGAREIEDVLNAFPGVHEAAVIGTSHDILGEAPVAFLSMQDDVAADVEAIKQFCRAKLPPHKMPVRFVVTSDLPKLAGVGKVDKIALAKLAESPE